MAVIVGPDLAQISSRWDKSWTFYDQLVLSVYKFDEAKLLKIGLKKSQICSIWGTSKYPRAVLENLASTQFSQFVYRRQVFCFLLFLLLCFPQSKLK